MKRLMIIASLFLVACSSPNPNAIPGLEPYDIYGNFEQKGFETEKISDPEFGTSWISKKQYPAINIEITTFSSDVKSVESIRAIATTELPEYISQGNEIFQFVSSFDYEKSDRQGAKNWVNRNYDTTNDTVIGTIKFSMIVPSEGVRMLDITLNK